MKTSIIHVVENALNYVDLRLIDHGKRVAFATWKLLRLMGEHDVKKLHKSTLIALLHDIGAYSMEDIADMAWFETARVWEHSVYGYLFIKHFTPVADFAPVVLFHHANCLESTHLVPYLRQIANVICITDRIDTLIQLKHANARQIKEYLRKSGGVIFDNDILKYLSNLDVVDIFNGSNVNYDFLETLYGNYYDDKTVEDFIRMIVYTIEFRNPYISTHTITSTIISEYLSNIVNISDAEKSRIRQSSMLHDLGKICIPLDIIDKPGRLTDAEMIIMKQHVLLTENILGDFLDDCALDLAIRHHEKLDGSGYPYGLCADDLTTGQRMVAVADIFSALIGERTYKGAYPKAQVVSALNSMADAGKIDRDIAGVAVREYDGIVAAVDERTRPVREKYEIMKTEYYSMLNRARHFKDAPGWGEISA